jgi:hypothetical protein
MAWTVATIRKDVVGSAREVILSCTADAAEQAVDTGLSYVYGFSVGQVSCATGAPHIRANQGSTSTALNGMLGCSGFVSGDVLLITVKGR